MSQSNIEIELIVTCGECAGAKVVYDPFGFGWEELCALPDDQYRQAMRDRGYGPDDRDDAGRRPPPEEGPCSECDGTGEQRKRITLDELANELAGRGAIGRSLRSAFDAIGP